MINDLYSDGILDAASSIPMLHRLDNPQASAKRVSRVCGSEIEVDLNLENGVVTKFGMAARACALGQASASIVGRNIIGASADELYKLRDEMLFMLKKNGRPPQGVRWRELAILETIRDYPQRHASTMLVFEAVCDCLDQVK